MGDEHDHLYTGENDGTNRSNRARDVPLGTVFSLLSSQRRRYTLYCLHRFPGSVIELDDLVQYVAALETNARRKSTTTDADADMDRDSDAVDDRSERERPRDGNSHKLAVDLLHNHLPKLADAGVIDYDARSGTIRYWVHPSLLEWLEHAERKERELRLGS